MLKGIARVILSLVVVTSLLTKAVPLQLSSESLEGSEWHIMIVDSVDDVGVHNSIAVDAINNPRISYYDETYLDLKYAWWNGNSWSNVTVDSAGDVGMYTSLALDKNGYPDICYYDKTNLDLKYAWWNGNSWSNVTVDSPGWVGWDNSIAIDGNDNPHISYWDLGHHDLKYAWKEGGVWKNETVDSIGWVGRATAIAVDGQNNPHIAYYDTINRNLKYAKKEGGVWKNETVDSDDDVGWYNSIALEEPTGFPHISYYDVYNRNLKYAKWDGNNWSKETMDSSGHVAWHNSIALDDINRPHVSYYNHTSKDLLYARMNGTGWSYEIVDTVAEVGKHNSLALDNNSIPHISYLDVSYGDLKYATKANLTSSQPPIANSGGPYLGQEGSVIAFDGTGSSDPEGGTLSYSWDFDSLVDSDGDGSFINDVDATGPTPMHTYYDDGIYVVTLTVTDSQGLQDTDQCNITVLNVAPIPEWTSRSADGTILTPPYPEGKEILFEATVTDPGIYDTFRYDWDFGDGTVYLDACPKVTHTYGDDKTYTVVLTVTDDDGGVGVDDTPPLPTTNEDPVPKIDLPFCIFVEGSYPCDAIGMFTDPGWLDTHSAVWDFGDGTSETAGLTVEHQPPDSTGWNLSSHLYGDNGLYTITFTVTDDDGGKGTATAEVPVQNHVPSFDLYVPITVNEGEQFVLGVEATDPGSDDLAISVDWGDGTSDSSIYYNDGVGPDPPNSGAGVFPFVVQVDFTHVYPDDGDYGVTVEVEDDDGGSDVKAFQIPVLNVAPTVTLEVLPIEVNASLRIAGEKWHDVTIELYEDGVLITSGTLVRYPGSPDDQRLDLTHLQVDYSKEYSATIRYTPDDDPINGQPNGANPCWIILTFSDGQELWIHHTFNVQHPDTYIWEVDLTAAILMYGLTFQATAFDPGADELTFTWDFGDGTNATSFYSNANSTYPVEIMEIINHAFPGSGTYVVVLTVEDDDGGVGTASVTIVIP